ncbi:hypothetical protein E0H36_02890 [Rhizobium leguminosarum bv. viciae]|nr:hypothetical protein E0H36_02890 [Rhizobium leguminosarum bv. viciae]
MAKGKGAGSNFRSAISGRFVTTKHGLASPRTTVREANGGGSTGGTYRSAISVSPLLASRSGLSTEEDTMAVVADKLAELVAT